MVSPKALEIANITAARMPGNVPFSEDEFRGLPLCGPERHRRVTRKLFGNRGKKFYKKAYQNGKYHHSEDYTPRQHRVARRKFDEIGSQFIDIHGTISSVPQTP